ncbi:MAG: hypothetical protein KDE54_06285 [Caldilineaceae bacterium]|nr:hypothetical protein [Caldilineaceae bacterium]MCB0098108.1 hypothetical protein [Caldilineaceae bacterium]MCB9156934.1 hypothetical protein [Caldilineaceae bacterium]
MSDLSEFAIHAKAELLFPAHLIPVLGELRGPEWQDLVEQVAALPETHPDVLAFVLMMIELDGCMKCNSNNYKFLRGCYLCATQTVQSFKGTDQELLDMYEKAKKLLDQQMQGGIVPGQLSLAV